MTHFVDALKNNTTRVIDGDTVEVYLDRGWKEAKTVAMRVYGIDTPENKKTKSGGELEKKAGILVGQVVELWIAKRIGTHQLYHVSTAKPKYAFRTIGRLVSGWPHFDGTDDDLTDYLLGHQLGKPYQGKKKEPWTEEELATIVAKAEELLAA